MVIRLPELLLFAEDVWRKALARLGPATDKHTAQSKMPTTVENPVPPLSGMSAPNNTAAPAPPPATTTTATTTTTTTTSTPPAATTTSTTAITKKRCMRRRTIHFTVFLAVFSTILSLLWVYTITAELRRKAFDANMTRDCVHHISMDNPQLVEYIRNLQLKATSRQEPLNATQTPEEQYVVNQLQGKRDGVYVEYLSRAAAASTTGWLDSSLGWRGLMVLTDPRTYLDAYRSTRNPRTRVLQACLSTDKDTKEITYHQETDVQVTKLGESPNSLDLPKDSLTSTRLICFPLYSILLAYNTTQLDYLNLDSSEVQDGLVLDTIPWDVIRISVLSIHWGAHHTDAETKAIVDKLSAHNYKHVESLPTGKLVFLYKWLKI